MAHYIGTITTHRWHLGYITPHRISMTCAGQAHEQDGQASEMPADFRESLRKMGIEPTKLFFLNQNLGFFSNIWDFGTKSTVLKKSCSPQNQNGGFREQS